MVYSYNRTKVADGAWFANFRTVPRMAMAGNSFETVLFEVERLGNDRFLMTVSSRGSARGSVQDVSDTMRFVANDIQEKARLFFQMGMTPHRYRIIMQSETQIDTKDQGVLISCTVDFILAEPEEAAEKFKAALRPLGIGELRLLSGV